MNYRDIVNRSIVNLENCEDEPIHIPGSIQPHGFLIAIDVDTYLITFCSENIDTYINFTYKEVLGKEIKTIFSASFVKELSDFKKQEEESVKIFDSKIENKSYSISLHIRDSVIIIEGEPTENKTDKEDKLYNSSKTLLGYIQDSFTLQELTSAVTQEIKKITEYDRVMVYRFDEMYNGEVIAESKEDHLDALLGLHYPHTDIPVQARELYLKNHLRIVADASYKPVPLYTLNDDNDATLDLSLSILRSVSPIHIQYLQNMGVEATLTISLIHKGRLWGLITCHHGSKKFLSQELRNTVKLFGHFITSQIDVRLINEENEIAIKSNVAVNKLISKNLNFERASIVKLFQDNEIVKLCNSIGASAIIGNQIYKFGDTPSDEDIIKLSETLVNLKVDNNFHTNTLSKVVAGMSSISDEFPGINYYYLGYGNDALIWYRKETIQDINWAGDPNKAIEKDANGLSPRKSFEKFTEVVKGSSKLWYKSEIIASYNFINFFIAHLRSITLNEEKENQKILTDALKDVNSELENLNWISTHDLQEPLRKIRMMASMIEEGEMDNLPKSVQNKILKMQSSAERMQTLILDILAYSKAVTHDVSLAPVNLNELTNNIKNELSDTLQENGAVLNIGDLPVINGISFLLKQVFLNIIYNSVKFKDKDRALKITIRNISDYEADFESTTKFHKIEIEDNGIGLDNEYRDRIFKIFSRLNDKSLYSGSGIGLALCKKIMDKHHGSISANGVLDEGTVISLYFPKT